MTKKLIALLLTLCMAAACASCATITISIPVEIATGQSGAVNTTPAPVVTEPAQTPTEQPAVPVDNTSQTPSPDVPADAPSGAPSTTAEVLKYYCDAYNKIGSEGKAVTRTYDYTSNYKNILRINNNSTLESIANSLMNRFMVETTDPLAGDAGALPPVGLTTLNITEDKVSSATCTDKGDTYEIVVKSTGTDDNYEADVNPGEGSAGLIGPLLRTDDVTGAAGSLISFEGLHAYYATASVTATVDKAGGHITKLVYETPCVLHFDQVTAAVIVKVKNCDIGLLFQQTWTVDY